jgi:hypothetical protein
MKVKLVVTFLILLIAELYSNSALAQSPRKKIRLSLSSTTVALLPTFAAFDKGFFAMRDSMSS